MSPRNIFFLLLVPDTRRKECIRMSMIREETLRGKSENHQLKGEKCTGIIVDKVWEV